MIVLFSQRDINVSWKVRFNYRGRAVIKFQWEAKVNQLTGKFSDRWDEQAELLAELLAKQTN